MIIQINLETITPLSLLTAAASAIQYVMDECNDALSKSSFYFQFLEQLLWIPNLLHQQVNWDHYWVHWCEI